MSGHKSMATTLALAALLGAFGADDDFHPRRNPAPPRSYRRAAERIAAAEAKRARKAAKRMAVSSGETKP